MNFTERVFPADPDDFCVVCDLPAAFTLIDGDAFCSDLCRDGMAQETAEFQSWALAIDYAEE